MVLSHIENLDSCYHVSAGDGVFSLSEGGYIKLVDLKSNTTQDLLAYSDIQDVGSVHGYPGHEY